jgi:DnaJ-class molecular chaperone
VDERAEPAEIRRAFRQVARKLHPDAHPHASDEERRALESQLAQVTAAYQTLVA